jgi:hypothetical protein
MSLCFVNMIYVHAYDRQLNVMYGEFLSGQVQGFLLKRTGRRFRDKSVSLILFCCMENYVNFVVL